MEYYCFNELLKNENSVFYTAYGIEYKSDNIEKRISDITLDKSEIQLLCADLNMWQPEECHIFDIVEDFIYEVNMPKRKKSLNCY